MQRKAEFAHWLVTFVAVDGTPVPFTGGWL
jgi:hypothetical protein